MAIKIEELLIQIFFINPMKIELLYMLCLLGLIVSNKNTYPPIDQKKIILSHYAIYGLLPVSKTYTDSVLMKSESDCFKTDRTFINGLLSAMTLSIYTPNKEFVISDELL